MSLWITIHLLEQKKSNMSESQTECRASGSSGQCVPLFVSARWVCYRTAQGEVRILLGSSFHGLKITWKNFQTFKLDNCHLHSKWVPNHCLWTNGVCTLSHWWEQSWPWGDLQQYLGEGCKVTQRRTPQGFWHQGPVAWKTISSQTGDEGDGFSMILIRSAQPRALTCAVHGRVCNPMKV